MSDTRFEFFFDCSSPWTYLAFENVQPIALRHDVEIEWRPILVGGIFNTVGTLSMTATIVAGNTAPLGPDVSAFTPVTSGGYNLIGDATDSTGFAGPGDQVGTAVDPIDPRLGPLADNGGPTQTHALLPGSPAIDAGTDPVTFCSPTAITAPTS